MQKNKIYCGDAFEFLETWADECIDCCVTSPPYWGLRDYGVEGQLGLEKTPEEYVSKMVKIFAEVKRVLKNEGTLWLNLGDSYAGNCSQASSGGRAGFGNPRERIVNRGKDRSTDKWSYSNCPAQGVLKPKDLCGIPWRVALALQADGWYLRSDIIWSKPNPMPESVTDRPTKAHEYLFLMSKNPNYYYDQQSIREPHKEPWRGKGEHESSTPHKGRLDDQSKQQAAFTVGNRQYNPAGRNRRTVWEINTKPYLKAHFATFPPKLIEPCILAGCPAEVCVKCGKGRERILDKPKPPKEVFTKTRKPTDGFVGGFNHDGEFVGTGQKLNNWLNEHPAKTTGWTSCKCKAEFERGLVLDPFMGSGTTAITARKLARNYVGIELNPEYIPLIEKRVEQEYLF